jgi:anti-sigma factor RsiW
VSRRWPFRRRSGLACREIVELVTDYLEGTLKPTDRTRFETHIAGCEACTAYLHQMRETLRVLGAILEDSISAELETELLTTFRDWKRGT